MNAKLRKRSGIAFFVAEDFHVSHHILVYPEFLIRLTLPGRFHMHQNIIDIIYRAFNTFLHRPGNLMRLCNRYLRIHLYIERNYIPVSYHSSTGRDVDCWLRALSRQLRISYYTH